MSSDVGHVNYGFGYATGENFFPRLEGKILTILESAGMQPKQEEAIKSLLRNAIWDAVFTDAVYISAERYTEIMRLYHEERNAAGAKGSPIKAI